VPNDAVICNVIEANEQGPYLCFALKVGMPVVREHAQPLRVESLAKIAGTGVYTLHHHFRALTAMSPLQYQKQIRLHAARERMLVDGLGPVRHLKSDTRGPANSIANTVASSANHPCGICGLSVQALCPWSRSVIAKAACDRVARERRTDGKFPFFASNQVELLPSCRCVQSRPSATHRRTAKARLQHVRFRAFSDADQEASF
jgi:AraC-like DNA-binding protein